MSLYSVGMQFGPQERYVLDKIITGEAPEVSGHAFRFDFGGRVKLEDDRYKVAF
ncbi:MAG: hypothetical protein P8X64_15365 [Anaerolineales bacterium]